MKTIMKDDEQITVFDNLEEMKWFFHKRLCQSGGSNAFAEHMMNMKNVEQANSFLKRADYPYRVEEG